MDAHAGIKGLAMNLMGRESGHIRYLQSIGVVFLVLCFFAVAYAATKNPPPLATPPPTAEQIDNLNQNISKITKQISDLKSSIDTSGASLGQNVVSINTGINNLNAQFDNLNKIIKQVSDTLSPQRFLSIQLKDLLIIIPASVTLMLVFLTYRQVIIGLNSYSASVQQTGIQLFERAISEFSNHLNVFHSKPNFMPYFFKANGVNGDIGNYKKIQKNDAMYNELMVTSQLILNNFASMLIHAVLSEEYPLGGTKETIKRYMQCPIMQEVLLENFDSYKITGLSLLLLGNNENIDQTKQVLESITDLASNDPEQLRRKQLLRRLNNARPTEWLLFTKEGREIAKRELREALNPSQC